MKQALEASGGDMHIVDDAEDWEVLEVLGMGTLGQAELRRSFDPEFADDFVVIKRVPVKALLPTLKAFERDGCVPFTGLYTLAVGLQLGASGLADAKAALSM